MKLYDYFRSSAAYRVRIALNLKRLSPERAFVHLRRGAQRGDEYLELNPQGLVPSLVTDGGDVLTQSLAIPARWVVPLLVRCRIRGARDPAGARRGDRRLLSRRYADDRGYLPRPAARELATGPPRPLAVSDAAAHRSGMYGAAGLRQRHAGETAGRRVSEAGERQRAKARRARRRATEGGRRHMQCITQADAEAE